MMNKCIALSALALFVAQGHDLKQQFSLKTLEEMVLKNCPFSKYDQDGKRKPPHGGEIEWEWDWSWKRDPPHGKRKPPHGHPDFDPVFGLHIHRSSYENFLRGFYDVPVGTEFLDEDCFGDWIFTSIDEIH